MYQEFNSGSYEYERAMNKQWEYQEKHPSTAKNHPAEDVKNRQVDFLEVVNEGED